MYGKKIQSDFYFVTLEIMFVLIFQVDKLFSNLEYHLSHSLNFLPFKAQI